MIGIFAVIYVFIGLLLSLRWFWFGMFGKTKQQDTYVGMAISALAFWPIGLWLDLEIGKQT